MKSHNKFCNDLYTPKLKVAGSIPAPPTCLSSTDSKTCGFGAESAFTQFGKKEHKNYAQEFLDFGKSSETIRDTHGRELIWRSCLTCSIHFLTRKDKLAEGRGKYCSIKCAGAGTSKRQKGWTGAKNNNWKGGVSKDHMRYRRRFLAKSPHKARVHRITQSAIRSGRLIPAPCETCGATDRIHAHHDNYRKPLSVRWLCQPCHNRHHAKLRGVV